MSAKAIFLDPRILRSTAFRELKNHSVKVLLWFLAKRVVKTYPDSKGNKNFRIKNNGKINFTYKEAERNGLSGRQFRDALDDLIAKGFLEITHQGTGTGDANTFKLCQKRWQTYGTLHFKPAEERRKRAPKGCGWGLYNQKKKGNSSANNDTRTSVKSDTQKEIIIIGQVSNLIHCLSLKMLSNPYYLGIYKGRSKTGTDSANNDRLL